MDAVCVPATGRFANQEIEDIWAKFTIYLLKS